MRSTASPPPSDADRVLTSDADLREFRDPFQHATWDTNTASAVVMPTTVEEIQEVLRVANEHKVPLWTHGTGRNNGYGGPAPRVRGSVIVSLRNMNRVLEINEESATPSSSPACAGSTSTRRSRPAATG